jgi:hypothetical protein
MFVRKRNGWFPTKKRGVVWKRVVEMGVEKGGVVGERATPDGRVFDA